MEMTRDTDAVGNYQQFIIALPTDQGIVLMDQDSSIDSTYQQSEREREREVPLCPAYHICKELHYPSSITFNDNFNQQVVEIFS